MTARKVAHLAQYGLQFRALLLRKNIFALDLMAVEHVERHVELPARGVARESA